MHFIILKLNVHKIKLNQDSKVANFNYKVQNCKYLEHLVCSGIELVRIK